MKPIEPRDTCPMCDGDTGYQTIATVSGTRYHDWDGTHIDTQPEETLDETSPKCADCGKSLQGWVA